MPNLKLAKQSAAFKACKLLYDYNELNENLMLMTVKRKFDSLSDIYFKHYKNFKGSVRPLIDFSSFFLNFFLNFRRPKNGRHQETEKEFRFSLPRTLNELRPDDRPDMLFA